jgi:hypothetical protein
VDGSISGFDHVFPLSEEVRTYPVQVSGFGPALYQRNSVPFGGLEQHRVPGRLPGFGAHDLGLAPSFAVEGAGPDLDVLGALAAPAEPRGHELPGLVLDEGGRVTGGERELSRR